MIRTRIDCQSAMFRNARLTFFASPSYSPALTLGTGNSLGPEEGPSVELGAGRQRDQGLVASYCRNCRTRVFPFDTKASPLDLACGAAVPHCRRLFLPSSGRLLLLLDMAQQSRNIPPPRLSSFGRNARRLPLRLAHGPGCWGGVLAALLLCVPSHGLSVAGRT
jgi:hypothetical protein